MKNSSRGLASVARHIHGGARASHPRRSTRIGGARDARQARPTANLDDLSAPGLCAIVALVLVEDRVGPLLCGRQVRAHAIHARMPASDA